MSVMDRDELERLYAEAGSFRQLGFTLGCSPITAKKRLTEAGIPVKGERTRAGRIDMRKMTRDELQAVYDETGSIAATGRALGGWDVAAVIYHLDRLGVPRKRTGFKSPRTVETPKGADHFNWKGGTSMHSDGYVLVYAPWHPAAASAKGYVLQHRLVMERHLGRYLTRYELVHHRNEIKTDNRLENLELTNMSEHMVHHKADAPRTSDGRFSAFRE